MIKDLFHIEAFETGLPIISADNTIPFHSVYVFTGGSGIVQIDGADISVATNEILIISKNQRFQVKENNNSGYCLKFTDSFWKQTPISANNCKAVLFDVGVIKHKLLVANEEIISLSGLFAAALSDYNSGDYSNKPDVLAAYLKIIIIKIANLHALLKEDIGEDNNKLYQDFISLVNNRATHVHDVATYAEALGVTARKLSAACAASGKGAKEIINERLVAEAKRELQFTGKAIKFIAAELHFATPYQFSSFFKKHTNISPENYRKQFVKIGI